MASSSGTVFNLQTPSQLRAPTSYLDGTVVIFRAPQSNTASVDIQLDSLGTRDLRRTDGTNFPAGTIQSGDMIVAQYILSEDRFRAFAGGQPPQNLQTGRGIRYSLINTSPIPVGGSTLTWGGIVHDDLTFNSGGNPTIPNGQGIERVDILVMLNPTLSTNDDLSVVLRKNNVPIAGGVIVQGSGSNFFPVAIMDEPVNDGDSFDLVADLDSGSAKNITGTFTLRVSKFAAP